MRFLTQKTGIFSLLAAILLIAPVFAFGGGKTIYVDKNANGSEEGTSAHSYHTIDRALDHAKSGDTVRVKSGTYKENIEIPSGVALRSDSFKTDAVTIKGDNDKPTVLMKHKSKLSKITIEGGRHGIRVKEDAKADIIDVLVKKSDRDGIHIDRSDKRDKKHRVYIEDSEIRESDRTGLYSERHYVVMVNTEIHDNRLDGIDFQDGVKSWLEKNRIHDNKGVALKANIDGSEILGKKNSFRDSGRDGIEVYALTNAPGKVSFNNSNILGNKSYGVAKVVKGVANDSALKNVFFDAKTDFERNGKGNISHIIRVR